MKVSKPVILHIPSTFAQELNKYLVFNRQEFKYNIVYFYYVAHHILVNQLKCKNRNENYLEENVPLNVNFLKSVTINNIGSYIKILLKGGFIICDNQYKIGIKSKGYKLNSKYLNGIEAVSINNDCKLFEKIIKNRNKIKAHHNRLPSFLKRMKYEFMRIELDYAGAEQWALNVTDEAKKSSYVVSIQQLKDKRFRYFKRNGKNHRLDTNLTNLKSDLRQFIIGDYISIDLNNSQPFFLNQLLNTIINQSIINQESLCCCLDSVDLVKTFGIKRIKQVLLIHQKQKKDYLVNLRSFEDAVNRGTFYDDFVKNYKIEITRAEVKKIMFPVLFSKNIDYNKHGAFVPFKNDKEVFAAVYPLVYESIKSLKEKDNKLLPVCLQKIESYIFIDCIAKKLTEAGIPPLTIHDSVIVKTEHQNKTIEIMKSVFMEHFKVIPTFNIKSLRK